MSRLLKESNEMVLNSIVSAAQDVGETVVSFGSGETNGSGRLGGRVDRGGAAVGRSSASSKEVSAVRRQINNSGASARARKAALQEIQDNASKKGKIPRGILRDILDDLLGR